MKNINKQLSFSLNEWLGAFGDIGVMIPLFLTMNRIIDFPLARSFLLAGILYLWCGLYYKTPVPVQPLKAMAAAVIAVGLPFETIRWAALFMGVLLLICAYFTINLEKIFTHIIVKSIQLALAVILLKTGISMIAGINPTVAAASTTIESIGLAIFFLVAPQLPLTLGNSIFACADAAKIYFKDKAEKVKPRALLTDLGITNIIAAIIGAYPLCHGAGGLTAHYSFGGRTGGTVIIAGIFYLLLSITGIFFIEYLSLIPDALLGATLIYISIRHLFLLKTLKTKYEWITVLFAGLIGGLHGNLAVTLIISGLTELIFSNSILDKFKIS